MRKLGPLFHALEHVLDARATFARHARTKRSEVILLAHGLLRPDEGDRMVLGVRIDPAHVLIGSLPKRFLRSRGEAGERIHYVFMAKLKGYIDQSAYSSYRSDVSGVH